MQLRAEEPAVGCFCRRTVLAMQVGAPTASATVQVGLNASLTAGMNASLIGAVSAWLSARWLPAPAWQPDPAWLELDLPTPQLPQESLAVILGLVQASVACKAELGLDLTLSADVARLARIVVTLNRRLPSFEFALHDGLDWALLANLNAQADLVIAAAAQGSFNLAAHAGAAEPSLAPWRPLLAKIKVLAPLLAIGQVLGIDLASPAASLQLAEQLRLLRSITIPALQDASLAMSVIARFNAIARLQASLGADPRSVPLARVQAAIERKLSQAVALLPPSVRLEAGLLIGLQAQLPNPGTLVTADTVGLAARISPALLALRWQVPRFDQLSVLTTVAPVVQLVAELRAGGIVAVLQAPCDSGCDAGSLSASLTA